MGSTSLRLHWAIRLLTYAKSRVEERGEAMSPWQRQTNLATSFLIVKLVLITYTIAGRSQYVYVAT